MKFFKYIFSIFMMGVCLAHPVLSCDIPDQYSFQNGGRAESVYRYHTQNVEQDHVRKLSTDFALAVARNVFTKIDQPHMGKFANNIEQLYHMTCFLILLSTIAKIKQYFSQSPKRKVETLDLSIPELEIIPEMYEKLSNKPLIVTYSKFKFKRPKMNYRDGQKIINICSLQRNSFKKFRSGKRYSNKSNREVKILHSSTTYKQQVDDRIIVSGRTGSIVTEYCIDTGASVSAISSRTYKQFIKEGVIRQQNKEYADYLIRDASGQEMSQTAKPIAVDVKIQNATFLIEFLVLNNLSTPLLGLDFLRKEFISVCMHPTGLKELRIGDPDKPIGSILCSEWEYNHVPTTCELKVGVNCLQLQSHCPGNTIMTIKPRFKSNLKILERQTQVKNGGFRAVIANVGLETVEVPDLNYYFEFMPLRNATVFATEYVQETNDLGVAFDVERPREPENQEDFEEYESEQVDEEELEPQGIDFELERQGSDSTIWEKDLKKAKFPEHLLQQFLTKVKEKCPKLFATHSLDCGKLDESIMVIDDVHLKPGVKVQTKPYKQDWIRKQQIDLILEGLVEAEIIEKGSSQHYSPVFVVPKKDNRLRLVTSYCLLNKNMKAQFYTIPDTKKVLNRIALANGGDIRLFTIIDLSNAYSSIVVRGKAREQMAIATETDTYLVNRLLFGTQLAPAKFNEAVKKVVDKMQKGEDPFCFNFFDDLVIVSGADELDHMSKVLRTMTAIAEAGFKIRADKCDWFCKKVNVLGCTMDRFGLSPQDRHVESIRKVQPPTNKKETQQLMGLLVWHSHFIPNFSEKMQPISQLIQKDITFHWGPEQQEALDIFKKVITNTLKIYFPNYSLPVYIACDSSDRSIGSCIYQVRTYKAAIKDLADNLLIEEMEEIETKMPMLPESGKNCPRLIQLHENDQQLLDELEDAKKLVINKKESENWIRICFPVAYFAKTLTKTQIAYPIQEKEGLAVILTIEHHKQLLMGFKIRYLISDSQPFLYMMKSSRAGYAKFDRWITKLQSVPMNFIIVHIRGKLNVVADYMSRNLFFAVEPIKYDVFKKNLPFLIKTPFKIGQIVTFEDIRQALNNNPNLVFNLPDITKESRFKDQATQYAECLDDGVLDLDDVENLEIKEEHNYDKIQPATANICSLSANAIGAKSIRLLKNDLIIENIIKEQQKDELCKQIRKQLDARKIFYEFQGVLYRKKTKDQSELEPGRIVIPYMLLPSAIAFYHYLNHAGAATIRNQLYHTYYHPKLLLHVQTFVSSCYLCLIHRPMNSRQPLALHPYIPICKSSLWSCDVVSGMHISNQYRAVLTVVDHYTQFVILQPLKYETADEIAEILINRVFSIFPLPDTIMSDNAANLLRSAKIRSVAYFYSIRIHLTAPYSSITEGKVEISNRKAMELLAKINDEFDRPWPRLLPLAQIFLNSKPIRSLGNKSPCEFMFGVKNKVRLNYTMQEKEIIGIPEAWKEWEEQKVKMDEITEKFMKKRNEINAAKYKRKQTFYEKGSFVVLKNLQPRTKKKLKEKQYRIPLEVIADLGNAVLVQDYQNRTRFQHKNMVTKYIEPPVEYYQYIPHYIKMRLGLSYTPSDIINMARNNDPDLPEVFKKGLKIVPQMLEKKKIKYQPNVDPLDQIDNNDLPQPPSIDPITLALDANSPYSFLNDLQDLPKVNLYEDEGDEDEEIVLDKGEDHDIPEAKEFPEDKIKETRTNTEKAGILKYNLRSNPKKTVAFQSERK